MSMLCIGIGSLVAGAVAVVAVSAVVGAGIGLICDAQEQRNSIELHAKADAEKYAAIYTEEYDRAYKSELQKAYIKELEKKLENV